jgi:peptide/nickel transport system ATP-binding protein
MLRHVLPNVMGPVLVIATLNLGFAILTEATLSFLGVGVPPTQPSLGTLIRIGNDFLFSGEWWITIFPGIALMRAGAVREPAGRLAARRPQPEAPLMTDDPEPAARGPNLRVEFPTRRGTLVAVDDVSFDIAPGEVLGVVGESGAGKSMTGAAIIGLLEPPGRIAGGEILLAGGASTTCPTRRCARSAAGDRRDLPGPADLAEPALHRRPAARRDDPTHLPMTPAPGARARDRLLEEVGIPAAAQRIDSLSAPVLGRHAPARGDRAGALRRAEADHRRRADHRARRLDPGADHRAAEALCREHGTAVMLVTHDMGVIAETADRVAVMYAGRIAEIGRCATWSSRPKHPYTSRPDGLDPPVGADRRAARADRRRDAAARRAIPKGCAFNPRCPKVFDRCRAERPAGT